MAETRSAAHWDQRYETGDLPWDSGVVEEELSRTLDRLRLPPGVAMDLGCGTGTNALWLAERGWTTTGLDLSAKAVTLARGKAAQARVAGIAFHSADLLAAAIAAPGSVDFIFDRGCWHSVPPEDQALFVRRVYDALKAGGYWLSLAGNADERRGEGIIGPPQMHAGRIVALAEPMFEIHELRRSHFHDRQGPTHLAWVAILRKRG